MTSLARPACFVSKTLGVISRKIYKTMRSELSNVSNWIILIVTASCFNSEGKIFLCLGHLLRQIANITMHSKTRSITKLKCTMGVPLHVFFFTKYSDLYTLMESIFKNICDDYWGVCCHWVLILYPITTKIYGVRELPTFKFNANIIELFC